MRLQSQLAEGARALVLSPAIVGRRELEDGGAPLFACVVRRHVEGLLHAIHVPEQRIDTRLPVARRDALAHRVRLWHSLDEHNTVAEALLSVALCLLSVVTADVQKRGRCRRRQRDL